MYPLFFTLFLLILLSNFLGLIPYGYSITSLIINNFLLSFSFVVGLTLLGFSIQGFRYLNLFVPSNVPTLLIPPLIVIEIISHVAKIFSLSIRLFANIMAGHILLHILTGFILQLSKINLILGFFPFVIVWIIIFLEFGITFLQAYVFIVLLTIYFEENLGLSKQTYSIIKRLNKLKSNYFIINTNFYNEVFFLLSLKKRKIFNIPSVTFKI